MRTETNQRRNLVRSWTLIANQTDQYAEIMQKPLTDEGIAEGAGDAGLIQKTGPLRRDAEAVSYGTLCVMDRHTDRSAMICFAGNAAKKFRRPPLKSPSGCWPAFRDTAPDSNRLSWRIPCRSVGALGQRLPPTTVTGRAMVFGSVMLSLGNPILCGTVWIAANC